MADVEEQLAQPKAQEILDAAAEAIRDRYPDDPEKQRREAGYFADIVMTEIPGDPSYDRAREVQDRVTKEIRKRL